MAIFANLVVRSASILRGTSSILYVSRDMTLWPKISAIGLVLLRVRENSFVSSTLAVVSQLCFGTWNLNLILKI